MFQQTHTKQYTIKYNHHHNSLIHSSSAIRRTTQTSNLILFIWEFVIIRDFISSMNITASKENQLVFIINSNLTDFIVWIARVIDKPAFISFDHSINHSSIIQAEEVTTSNVLTFISIIIYFSIILTWLLDGHRLLVGSIWGVVITKFFNRFVELISQTNNSKHIEYKL